MAWHVRARRTRLDATASPAMVNSVNTTAFQHDSFHLSILAAMTSSLQVASVFFEMVSKMDRPAGYMRAGTERSGIGRLRQRIS